MFIASLLLSFALIVLAIALQWYEKRGWSYESCDENREAHPSVSATSQIDREYYSRRMRSRSRVHTIMGICAGLIMIAAFSGGGFVWMGAWICVMIALMLIIVLAGFDAYHTHRYHQAKLPEVRRQFMLDE